MRPFDRAEVPDALASWLSPGVVLTFPEQGMTSQVAVVEPRGVVFKRCTDPLYVSWLRRERDVLDALSETELPVPRALDYVDLGTEVWLVMSKLRGVQCGEILLRSSRSARMDLLRATGAAIRKLHGTAVPTALREDRPWLGRILDAAQANLPWCDGSKELLEHLRETSPDPVPQTLIHGDLNLENLLVSDGAITGFVDWAGGDEGDPRCDVALALLNDDELVLDDEMLQAFFSGYGRVVEQGTRKWFEDLYEFF